MLIASDGQVVKLLFSVVAVTAYSSDIVKASIETLEQNQEAY